MDTLCPITLNDLWKRNLQVSMHYHKENTAQFENMSSLEVHGKTANI
jgi:hypothetical protein